MDRNKLVTFFINYIKAVRVSRAVKRKTLLLVDTLIQCDPLKKTNFEVSFKLANNEIPPKIRLLNMDAEAYSHKNPKMFLMRLSIYKMLIEEMSNNPQIFNVFEAMSRISKTPMSLYFGADIEECNYLFAFWLIFGGVKRTGEISFWPYDFGEIISKILAPLKLKRPNSLRKDMLNFGLDIDNKNIFYKLYYLCRDGVLYHYPFTDLMRRINRELSNFKYFYFFSQMYNKKGNCIKTKLFTEFLEDMYPNSEKMPEFLRKVLKINNTHFNPQRLMNIFKLINGRLSLISFENDGTLTFYIRPN